MIKKLLRENLYEARVDGLEIDSNIVAIVSEGPTITLFDLTSKTVLGFINVYNNEVTGVSAKKGYGPLMYELGMSLIYPNGLQSDRRGNTTPEAERMWNYFINGGNPNVKVVKLNLSDKEFITHYKHDDSLEVPNYYNYKLFNSDKTTLNRLVSNGNKLEDDSKNKIIDLGKNFYDSFNL